VTATEFNGDGVPVAEVQEGGEEVARKLLRVDVVMVVSSVWSKSVTVCVFVMLGIYFVSAKYMFVCIKLMCVYVKFLKI
jgi:hypothetical protein